MNRARVRFALALVAFLAWLGWLAVAVAEKGKHPVVSRAQLAAATHVVVATVTAGPDDLPATTATVTRTLRGTAIPPGTVLEVFNLSGAQVPGAGTHPAPGEYLIALVSDGRTYRVAGLPRSPGYEPAEPDRPMVYPWDAATSAQLRALGISGGE